MKKILRIIAIIIAFVLLFGILYVANGFLGNPISKGFVTNNAEEYIKETYPNTDYYIESVNYSFKTGGYYAHVRSLSSEDSSFSVSFSMFGELKYDNYESYVQDRFNTWLRINDEYREKSKEVFLKFPYETDISSGEIQTLDKEADNTGLDMKTLELDKQYDINELSKLYGRLTLYIETEDLSPSNATQILLDVRQIFDENELGFHSIDLTLMLPLKEDGIMNTDSIELIFYYEDIYEQDMLTRVTAAIEK